MEEVNLKFLSLCYDIRVDVEKQSVGVYNIQRDPEAGCPVESHSAYATGGEHALARLQKPSLS